MSLFFPHYCEVTPTMLASAQAEANRIGHLNNSIREGGGNLVGCLGEQTLLILLPGATSDNTYNHDVTYLGKTFECKTKDRTVPPQAGYNASVAIYNTKQTADYYAFFSAVRTEDTADYTRVYFCGLITPKDFYEKSGIVEEGDHDSTNNWIAPATSRSLHYSQLDRCL
jgi:hypothetical protein